VLLVSNMVCCILIMACPWAALHIEMLVKHRLPILPSCLLLTLPVGFALIGAKHGCDGCDLHVLGLPYKFLTPEYTIK
jgi:hypothetical protein